MIIVVGLAVFVLHTGIGVTRDEDHSQLRMAVDPTVIPVVLPDGTETPIAESVEPEAPLQEEAKAETPAPAAPEQPVAEPASAPKPAPKPAAKTASKSTGKGTVRAISLNETATGFTVTILADRPIGDTSYMNLSGPRRLVIDLREGWKLNAKNVVRGKDGAVKHIVIGNHPDRLRLVVHFTTPPAGKLNPEFERTGNSLKVTIPLP